MCGSNQLLLSSDFLCSCPSTYPVRTSLRQLLHICCRVILFAAMAGASTKMHVTLRCIFNSPDSKALDPGRGLLSVNRGFSSSPTVVRLRSFVLNDGHDQPSSGLLREGASARIRSYVHGHPLSEPPDSDFHKHAADAKTAVAGGGSFNNVEYQFVIAKLLRRGSQTTSHPRARCALTNSFTCTAPERS